MTPSNMECAYWADSHRPYYEWLVMFTSSLSIATLGLSPNPRTNPLAPEQVSHMTQVKQEHPPPAKEPLSSEEDSGCSRHSELFVLCSTVGWERQRTQKEPVPDSPGRYGRWGPWISIGRFFLLGISFLRLGGTLFILWV